MNRKRLLSILSGMALSLGVLAGPAVALEADTDNGLHLDAEIAELDLDSSEEEATVEVVDESVTLAPDDDEPVRTSLEADGGDDGSPTDPVVDLVDGDDGSPEPSDGDPEGTPGGDDEVRSAGNDTVQAPTPYERENANTPGRAELAGGYSFDFATQRPAPASSYSNSEPEVAEPAELAPEVAPPRDSAGTEVVNLASTPITDPAQAPHALKVLAALLVAGTALSWWNAREVVAESAR